MEKITIKNFGPIKHAEIEIKDICVLIGHTSSGKSTVAKLLAIFNSWEFYCIDSQVENNSFITLLKEYGIDFPFRPDTLIIYQKEDFCWNISMNGIESTFKYSTLIKEGRLRSQLLKMSTEDLKNKILTLLQQLDSESQIQETLAFASLKENPIELKQKVIYLDFQSRLISQYFFKGNDVIYTPAERIFMSILSQNIFGLYDKGVHLPACLIRFADIYSLSKHDQSDYNIELLGLNVHFDDDKGDYIQLQDGERISMSQASSGLQSSIPMLTVFDQFVRKDSYFIVEEPELNLYTKLQKDLTEYLVKQTKEQEAKLFITTHSPYILSTLQNLLQAGNIAKMNKGKAEQVEQLIPRNKWIDSNQLTCIFMGSNGICKNILDPEYQTIGINEMDDVSEELSEIYDSLLELKYHE